MATRLGDHRFDDKLDDLSAEARAANVERDRKALADLPGKVDYKKLSRDGQIDYEILRQHLDPRRLARRDTSSPFEDDPRIYGDYLTESVYLLLTQSTPAEGREPQERPGPDGRDPPGGRGRPDDDQPNPPRVKVETAIRQTKGAIGFYTDDLFTLAGEPKGEGELGERAGRRSSRRSRATWSSSRTRSCPARPTTGGSARELFARKLDLELDAGLSADEVLARGRVGGEPRRARDGRDRPPAVGDDLPRRADPARRRRRAGAR